MGVYAVVSKNVFRFCKGDLLAVLLVAVLALAVGTAYMPSGDQQGANVEIYQDGKMIRTVSLAEDQAFVVEGAYTNRVEVRDGRIAITESDCPGTDCVYSGFVGTPNRSIVCLPNGVELRIVADEADVDFVVR